MFFLALDTSSISGSIAIFTEEKLLYSEYLNINITHSEKIMPMISRGLRLSGISKKDLNAIAIVNGPGSFTGIRIGLATAKGLSYGLQIPIIPFYSNEVLAVNLMNSKKHIISVIDARMKEVYVAVYDCNLKTINSPYNCKPQELNKYNDKEYILVGDGCIAYKEILKNKNFEFVSSYTQNLIKAEKIMDLIKIRKINLEYDFDFISKLEPYYLRKSQAELAKENKK